MPKPIGRTVSSDAVSRRMARTGPRDTAAEMRIRRILHGMGFRYRVDFPVLQRPKRKADLVFTLVKVAVFIDGCFWHGCPEHGSWPKTNADFWRAKLETNQKRDLDTNQRLKAADWIVVRIWEHEKPQAAAEKIAREVRKRIL